MTTDTLQAEDEMTEPRRFPTIEEMVMFHNPSWAYLTNATLPVREPIEAETAAYAARHEDPSWDELYNPAEPRIPVLPPSAPEITALLESATGEQEAVEGKVVPDDVQQAAIQQDGLASLARWTKGADTGSLSVVRDDPEEVHHENKTVTLRVVPESGEAS